MTQVLICHNATDRLQAAVVWLGQEAARHGVDDAAITITTVIYITHPQLTLQLDHLLWSLPPAGFLPHCRANSTLAAETPIIIAESAAALHTLHNLPQRTRLLNLDHTPPPGYERYTHMIEIISQEEDVRQHGRERVRTYREQGHDIQYRDLQKEPL